MAPGRRRRRAVSGSMQGKTCLITGANAGIGKAAAIGLARQGARVVLLCRSESRGRAAMAEIERRSGNGSLDLLIADLASQAQIRKAAEEYLRRFDRLDVLLNNAAVLAWRGTPAERGRARDDFRGQPSRAVPADRPVARTAQGVRARAHRHRGLRGAQEGRARLRRLAERTRLLALRGLQPLETGERVLHLRARPAPRGNRKSRPTACTPAWSPPPCSAS